MRRPPHEIDQSRALDWLAVAHVASEAARGTRSASELDAFRAHMEKLINRCACSPSAIATRGHVVPDVGRTTWDDMLLYDFSESPAGRGTGARTKLYADVVATYFEEEYEHERTAPSDLIHVTCTGYVSPSGAQRIVERRGWGDRTRVTHAYHMGCYAALPAVRLAVGALRTPHANENGNERVDVVHTELCSLHLDPTNHSAEQLVVQSLFGDGLIRYAVSAAPVEPALHVIAMREAILPDSSDAMSWVLGDSGMAMTLSARVPDHIARALDDFVRQLFRSAELDPEKDVPRAVFAVHPGGPRILDAVRDRLGLTEEQIAISRGVLLSFGNMSSATLPHVWMRVLGAPEVPCGTLVASLAFGPGLTVCGALFRKE